MVWNPPKFARIWKSRSRKNFVDLKVVQNDKCRHDKNQRTASSSCSNLTNDVETVISALYQNSFIRSVIASSDKKPQSIICYTDDQIEDMRNCMTNDSIIGIEMTFNLGPCFLTTLVYQNFYLVRTDTQTSPIVLGPIFLHWNGLYPTYCDFFV